MRPSTSGRKRIVHACIAAGGGAAVTALLFLLIPLLNRAGDVQPSAASRSRVHWLKVRKRPPAPVEPPPPRPAPPAAPRIPPPPPPVPQPRFHRPAPPAAPAPAPPGPLRADPFDLGSGGAGGLPLYIPPDPPPESDGAGPEEPPPDPEKTLYLPEEIDEPPRPLRRVPPRYPSDALRRGVEGFAVLRFVVDARGAVGSIAVASWEGSPRFGDEAEKALARWTFAPGRFQGRPVAVRCILRFTFREED